MTWRVEPVPAGPLSAASLAALHALCFPDEPWDAAAMQALLGIPGCFGAIAWPALGNLVAATAAEDGAADSPVGYALALDLSGEVEILSIGMIPACRQGGGGAALLHHLLDEAGRRGAASMVLEVAMDNVAALALYLKLGFAPAGRRRAYYARSKGAVDALIMRLQSTIQS